MSDFTAQVENINFQLCICEADFLLKHVCALWRQGERCECVYCRLAGRLRSALAWPEGSQQLHNALQHRQQGLLPPPGAWKSLFPHWRQVLSKAGSRYLAERAGLGVRDKSKEKTSSRMMALGDKQPLTCELLLEGNRIFPAPWFLHVLLITFISKSFSYSELLLWGHMCFSRNCFL